MTDQPDIFIGEIRIQEPIITLTCFVVTAFSFIGYYKTRNISSHQAFFLYRWFVLLIGISTLIGAFVGHAFQDDFGIGGKFSTWFTSMVGVSLAQQASFVRLRPYITSGTYTLLSVLNVIQLLSFITVTVLLPSFLYVEIH